MSVRGCGGGGDCVRHTTTAPLEGKTTSAHEHRRCYSPNIDTTQRRDTRSIGVTRGCILNGRETAPAGTQAKSRGTLARSERQSEAAGGKHPQIRSRYTSIFRLTTRALDGTCFAYRVTGHGTTTLYVTCPARPNRS